MNDGTPWSKYGEKRLFPRFDRTKQPTSLKTFSVLVFRNNPFSAIRCIANWKLRNSAVLIFRTWATCGVNKRYKKHIIKRLFTFWQARQLRVTLIPQKGLFKSHNVWKSLEDPFIWIYAIEAKFFFFFGKDESIALAWEESWHFATTSPLIMSQKRAQKFRTGDAH